MSRASNTGHVGLWMENGSGGVFLLLVIAMHITQYPPVGFFGDITINGGAIGLNMGNQQFTVRNVVVNYAQVGIYLHWSWSA